MIPSGKKWVSFSVWIAVFVGLSATVFAGFPYTAPGTGFLAPGEWNVGDIGSTNQEWDQMFAPSGNSPDISHVTNPAGLTTPTLSATSPGFPTGSFNFYGLANYGGVADIPNHTGYGSSYGTHVIVQTSATINDEPSLGGPGSVLHDTLEIVDASGSAISGGDNLSALRQESIWMGVVGSSMGAVTLETYIWEFFLPNYTGDFRVQWDQLAHSSFDQLRVDSMIAESVFEITPIPEPATALLLPFAMFAVRRRCLS